ncbi:MAG: OmpH family outer membrane protein [Bacteroidaceae bacterium]|nr:OmpH family outer membrane protein [Bacteroidaceae bacterium]
MFLVAQNKFGYFSYSAVLDSLPQYHEAMNEYNKLKQRCKEEIEHNELQLTRAYVSFLDGHRSFPEPILRKRQNELQQMIDNSVHFRDEVKKWLREAKDSFCTPCYDTIAVALKKVCTERSLAYAIDVDRNIYKYINPEMGEDITEYILRAIFHIEPVSDEIVEIKQQETVATEISTDVVSSTDEIMTEDTGLETVDVVESAEITETTEIAEENTVVLE